MFDVITFGETMVRLSPPNYRRVEQTNTLDVSVGGAELSVAAGLARLGLKVSWVSRLTENALGRMIRNKAREQGVDTSHIVWTKDDRIGLYFYEFGASPRASKVIYDRANSATSRIKPGDIDWQELLKQTKWFYTTGITPALSSSAAQVTTEAIKTARMLGCKVAYDLNYRAKLWSQEEARRFQEPLMEYVNVLISTEEDTEKVLGIRADSYEEVARKLADSYKFDVVCITVRETESVLRNRWTAIAYSDGKTYEDRVYDVEIIDRLGAGDSFAAGFLYGYITDGVEKGLQYGVAYSAIKHSVAGDINWTTLEEVEGQVQGTGLRVNR